LAAIVTLGVLISNPEKLYMAPFRESQTALTVRFMKLEGTGMTDYSTPLFGRPWQIPFEFGLFQWLVARVPQSLAGEATAGRMVSGAFYALCGVVVWLLCRQLGLSGAISLWAAAVFVLAPVHLAYGTAFMIESLALFLALVHLYFGLRWLCDGKAWSAGLCILAGVLAAMIKGTTWAPAAAVLGCLGILALFPSPTHEITARVKVRRLVVLGLCLGAALWGGLVWVAFTDAIKAQNVLGRGLISENLTWWYYGTWQSKLSARVWLVILGQEGLLLFGPVALMLPFIGWQFARAANSQAMWQQLVLVGGFFLAPAVFTNLHYRHHYYLWANGVYLVVATAGMLTVLPDGRLKRAVVWALPVSCLMTSLAYIQYHRSMRYAVEDRVISALSSLPRNGSVAFSGFDWSAYIPYHAGQRALFTWSGAVNADLAACRT
jgi:hypothetical protein